MFTVATGILFLGVGLILQTVHKRLIRRVGAALVIVGLAGVVSWFGYFRSAGAQTDALPTINQTTHGDCSPAIVGSGNTTNCETKPTVTASPQIQGRSNDPLAPWETAFTIDVNKQIQTGEIKLTCDGPCLKAGIGPTKNLPHSSLSLGANGPLANDPDTVLYQVSPLQLNPGVNFALAVFAANPVHVIAGSIGAYQITFPAPQK